MQVRVKICGLTRVADVEAAVALGADAIGLNFYPASPRYIDIEQAGALLTHVPPAVEAVGLFVNPVPADIEQALARLPGVTSLQIHQDRPEPLPALTTRYVQAWPVSDEQSLTRLELFLALCERQGRMPAAVLVDAHVAGLHGGTGRQAPWQLLAEWQCPVPVILAGGLTAENVAEAVRVVRPYGVDVASGVEAAPGVKDVEKMRRFIDAVRSCI